MQFAGKLVSSAATCPQTQGTLIIQNDQVVFSPADGTWTLEGSSSRGQITITKTRPSFDHKAYTTTLTATQSGDRVTGTYTTPSCRYVVELMQF